MVAIYYVPLKKKLKNKIHDDCNHFSQGWILKVGGPSIYSVLNLDPSSLMKSCLLLCSLPN